MRLRVFLASLIIVAAFASAPAAWAGYGLFADCLRREGAVFYTAYWCPHCREQLRMFSGYESRLKVVQCFNRGNNDKQRSECKVAGIQSYPTWTFADGSRRSGVLSTDDLSDITGCQKP